MRGSPRVACLTTRPLSCVRMERNFHTTISWPSSPLRRWRNSTGPGELSLTPSATPSSSGEINIRMRLDSTTSSARLTSRFTPVKGVSHRPTTGTPFTSCSRPWMMVMPSRSGT